MAELREQLARTPAEVVIANHAFGLFELAALHLSLQPPQLDQARLAIDALAALVDGLGDRLGEPGAAAGRRARASCAWPMSQIHGAHHAEGGELRCSGCGPAARPPSVRERRSVAACRSEQSRSGP